MTTEPIQEQGINLRDYLNILIRQKWIIFTVFIIAVIASVVTSLATPKEYRSDTTIMIVPSRMQMMAGDLLEGAQQKSIGESLNTHLELLTANIVIKRVIDALKLTDSMGEALDPSLFAGKLSVTNKKGTSLVKLEARDSEPQRAQDIVNTWAKEYIEYSQEIMMGEIKGTGEFITDRFTKARENLYTAEKGNMEIKNRYRFDMLKTEINMKKNKLNSYKQELVGMEFDLSTKKDYLAALKKEIAKQDKLMVISKGVTDDILWEQVSGRGGIEDLEGKKVMAEEINPIYRNLEERIVNTEIEIGTLEPRFKYLKKNITQTENSINKQEESLYKGELEIDRSNRAVVLCRQEYNAFSKKIGTARVMSAAQLGEVKLISPALAKVAIGPARRQKVAMGAVMGLMLGVFAAFLKDFWEKTKR